MSRKNTIIIGIMLVLFALMIISETTRKRINWYPSYAVKHKIPMGSYVAHQEAQEIFADAFHDLKQTPYVFVNKNKKAKGIMVYYNSNLQFGETNLNALLDWVDTGNSLFLSAEQFDKELLDTLDVELKYYYNTDFDKHLKFNFINPSLKLSDTLVYNKQASSSLIVPDTNCQKKIRLLGEVYDKKSDSLYNFVQVKFGNGNIYLHTFPSAFTNYFILKDDSKLQYFEGLLSYINTDKSVYWDTYYKNGSHTKGVFEYILSNEAFLWAYRLTFLGLFLYILFEGKRKQKPIPIVEPLRNESLSFSQTIADMYLQNKEHRLIALMHIRHFMDFVRTKLHIDIREWNTEMMNKIAEKTKTEKESVKDLFILIDEINNADEISINQVMELEKMINEIKK